MKEDTATNGYEVPTKRDNIQFRIEEYKIISDKSANLTSTRQGVDNLFIGINTLILTGFGYILFAVQIDNWSISIIFGSLSMLGLFVNIIWYRLQTRYKNLIAARILYLTGIEKYLENSGFELIEIELPKNAKLQDKQDNIIKTIGINTFENDSDGKLGNRIGSIYGFSALMQGLIQIFISIYVAVTFISIILNILTSTYPVIIKK